MSATESTGSVAAPTANAGEPSAQTAEPTRAPRRTRTRLLALIAVLLAFGLGTLGWLDMRERIGATQDELARRLRDIEADAREARAAARQAQESAREAQG